MDTAEIVKKKCALLPVLGSGGVGKTTTAASVAMALAEQGKRVVVITVDPAHRLAQVLGLDKLSNEPKKVTDTAKGGELWALWLDTHQALEDLVRKHASKITSIDRVLNNRLFKIIQSQLGGVEEYLGVEKVLALGDSGNFDVCVLDTPPSRHAIDFLESPRHILKFLDESVLRVFLKEDEEDEKKQGFFKRLFQSGKGQVLDVFKNFLGHTFLGELSDLLQNLKPVRKVFMDAAVAIEAWVREPTTQFALVSTLEPYPLDEARLLQIELSAGGLKAPGIIILNKCLPASEIPAASAGSTEPSGDAAVVDYLRTFQATQLKLRTELEQFRKPETAVVEINRYSVKQLSTQQLLDMGTRILKSWQSKNPKIFS